MYQKLETNGAKLNPDKTRLMVVCRPNRRDEVKNFVLRAGDFIIEQKDKAGLKPSSNNSNSGRPLTIIAFNVH